MRWAVLVLLSLTGCGHLYLDAYVGGNVPTNEDVEDSSGSGSANFDGIVTAGGRLGAYGGGWGPVETGFAVDASASIQQIEDADFSQVPVAFLFMARMPFGALEPYAGVGPSVVVSFLDDFSATVGSDESVDVGLDFRAGAKLRLGGNLGLFGEYRLTYSDADFDLATQSVRVESLTNHFLVGVSLSF